ncbi:MAG: HIT family protein [Rhodocyclales bacterium GT-UBC]|nr:MAG: HIT family protein [Rhodocyclales bacterium GT-UBC]
MENQTSKCELCAGSGGKVLWEVPTCRVIRVDDDNFPGFCRVIWTAHVREMTDLLPEERNGLMQVVFAVESAVRSLFAPDKINLASFGNVVPHLHWHIIPRWHDDRNFPEPIWGAVQRQGKPTVPVVDDASLTAALVKALGPAR